MALAGLAHACNFSSPEKTVDKKSGINPPAAEKIPHELVANGNKRIDNYYWMKLTEEQRNSAEKDQQTQKVLNYLTAENGC